MEVSSKVGHVSIGIGDLSEIHLYLVTRNVLVVYVESSVVANSIEESGTSPLE